MPVTVLKTTMRQAFERAKNPPRGIRMALRTKAGLIFRKQMWNVKRVHKGGRK